MPESNSEKLLYLFHYCSIAIGRARHHAAPHDMHHGQSRLLSILASGRIARQRELADEMRIRPTSLCELLGKLEKSGYVDRSTNPKDKRLVDIALTPLGERFAAQTSSSESAVADSIFSSLSAQEKEQLISLLEKVVASLDRQFEDAEPEGHHHHGFGHEWGHERGWGWGWGGHRHGGNSGNEGF